MSSLQKVTGLKRLSSLYAAHNCLQGSQLDTSIVTWLDRYKRDDWTLQNEACSASFITPNITV